MVAIEEQGRQNVVVNNEQGEQEPMVHVQAVLLFTPEEYREFAQRTLTSPTFTVDGVDFSYNE